MINHAKNLLEKGYKAFPLSPHGKAPYLPGGFKIASRELTQIDDWWGSCPQANVGLPMALNGLIGVDVDSYKDDCDWNAFIDGKDSLQTWTQRSASGGIHYIYRWDAALAARTRLWLSSGEPVRCVDIKYNGYLVAAGSVIEGVDYETVVDMEPVQAPDWLLEPPPDNNPGRLAKLVCSDGDPNADYVRELLAHIDPSSTHDTWVRVLMGLHHYFGGSELGLHIADEWSAQSNKYEAGLVRRKWESFS